MKPLPEMLTIEQVAERLSIRTGDVLELVQDETLSGYRLGGQIRVLASDVNEYLRALGSNDNKSAPLPPEKPVNLPLIVTKFPELTKWLKYHFDVIGQEKERPGKGDVMGRVVFGDIPYYYAILTAKFYRIEVPYTVLAAHPTIQELDAAGARLVSYKVEAEEIIEPAKMNGNGTHIKLKF